MSNAQHMSNSAEWGTPSDLIESSRIVLGDIDLDPATTAVMNAKTVRARSYYTADHDALSRGWSGRVFVNPPGSCPLDQVRVDDGIVRVVHTVCMTTAETNLKADPKAKLKIPPCSCRLVTRFWDHLISEHERGRVTAAIWIGFSLEQLSALQKSEHSPMDYPLCVCGPSRVRYLDPDNDFMPAGSPTHSSFVSYMGPTPSKFWNEFRKHGTCK